MTLPAVGNYVIHPYCWIMKSSIVLTAQGNIENGKVWRHDENSMT